MNPAQHVDLNDLLAFAAVAEAGSFTAAAERLDSSKARLSLQVRRLETALAQELFHRTTRRLTLSEAGAQLLEKSIPPLRLAIDGLSQASRGAAPSELTGTLRIASTVEHAVHQLAAYVAEFAALHPKLEIDLRSNDRVADLVRDGIDIALRKGWLPDSSLRAVKLGRFEQILVASPDYLKRAGRPKKPEDLAQHDWLALTLLSTPLTWKFSDKNGRSITVRMSTPACAPTTQAPCAAWPRPAPASPRWTMPVGLRPLKPAACNASCRSGTYPRAGSMQFSHLGAISPHRCKPSWPFTRPR